MWCVNPMVVDAWKGNPYPGYVEYQEGLLEAEEKEDKVEDHIPSYPKKSSSLTRSVSCNRINLTLPDRRPKRSLSTSGAQRSRPVIKPRLNPKASVSSSNLNCETTPIKEKLKRSSSVLSRLARQYSFSRSRRTSSSSSKEMNQEDDTTTVVTKGRRRRNKNSKKDSKEVSAPSRLFIPKFKHSRTPSPEPVAVSNSHVNGEGLSSPDSIPNSPSHFQTTFTVSPPTPELQRSNKIARSLDSGRTISPVISADESPLPSPPLEDKAYDSGRMSMSSFRSYSSGRPTSMSSVTSSISSRTSRGSDYFSSASSGGLSDQQNQITSHRFGLQPVLPDLNESDSADRHVLDNEGGETENEKKYDTSNSSQTNSARNSRSSAFIAHDRHNKDLNDVDHLAPVANLAMVVNPDLSYVDRIILELLETERMYVRSLRDILTGYLAVIRSNPELNIKISDVEDLFGNIRDIYDFNRNLLAELEACQGDPQRIAQCFVSKDDDYKVYTEYCTNYPSSVSAMTRCMKDPNLENFFKAQQEYLGHTLSLGSYLLKPVQRVLKYHLLLQELVKHCDKNQDGYQTIEKALQTMTRVARHINEMKRKHEDAVHIQEIQCLLTNWQGNELATYGELILESEMKMQGAKNERQVFLFEKMILITKRREDGYLVCKASIMCSKLVLLESIPNTPLGFQIQSHDNNIARRNNAVRQTNSSQQDSNRVEKLILLAPTQDEKSLWTYHIKRLIIETMIADIPLEAKKSIMRMRPVRDGDADGDSEEDRMRKKSKARFGSSAILGTQDGKSNKSPLSRLTGGGNNTSSSSANTQTSNQAKPRRRSDSMSRKSLHRRALQRRKDEIESSDDISADSGPNTPSGMKVVGKFSFPSFRQSTRSVNVQQAAKPSVTQANSKSMQGKTNGDLKKSPSQRIPTDSKKTTPNQNGEVAKRHHNSVIYRRHKRRTSQPITFTEKRRSRKINDGDSEKKEGGDEKVLDDDDLMNFNPLTARESVSWDIQIVEAVFERYKKEESSTSPSVIPDEKASPDLESTYLTVPSNVAPAPLMSLTHTPILSERRKSRIVVVPSSDSSEDEKKVKKHASAPPPVVRRRKNRSSQAAHRKSGAAYALPESLDVESDSGISENRSNLRKVVQASENARKSLVIHESDTELETNRILMEKADTVRKKSSTQRRERNSRKKNHSGNSVSENNPQHSTKSKEETPNGKRRGSLYDNIENTPAKDESLMKAAVTSSVQSMSTPTISVVDSNSKTTTQITTVQSVPSISITSTSASADSTIRNSSNDNNNNNSNNNNNNNNSNLIPSKVSTPPRQRAAPIVKDMKNIPNGKVRGLIERIRNTTPNTADVIVVGSNANKTPLTSPTISTAPAEPFSLEPKKPESSSKPDSISSGAQPRDSKMGNENPRRVKRVITTESLPLTLTSSSNSSSSCEDEDSPTIAERVKRLSINECDANQEETKKAQQNPLIFLRRTFSQDNSNCNTRHSTNLFLEARTSGEFNSTADLTIAEAENQEQEEEFKFEPVEDAVDAKHYLFEKLCLGPPGELKITDKMSEEFEHVCSDLENSRFTNLETQTFDASEDESAVSPKLERPRELFPKTRTSRLGKTDNTSSANVTAGKIKSQNNEPVGLTLNSSAQKRRIRSTKSSDSNSELRPCERNILPNRTDSLRSTKSEYVSSSQGDSTSRYRSSLSRSRNPIPHNRLPSKDMHAIPQMNVARLAKQFSENCTTAEKALPSTPRRSKSVGGAARTRQRMQERQAEQKKREESLENESPKAVPDIITNPSPRRGRSEQSRTPRQQAIRGRYEKAEIKVEEVEVCRAVDYSAKLLIASAPSAEDETIISPISIDGTVVSPTSTGDDDVFSASSPKSPSTGKKLSLIEMFAVNPNKISDSSSCEPTSPKTEEDDARNEETNENHTNKIEGNENRPKTIRVPASQNVRVILVQTPEGVEGRGGLEPKVLNSPSSNNVLLSVPQSAENQNSLNNISSANGNETQQRTRLRSSSLTRMRMRAALSPDS